MNFTVITMACAIHGGLRATARQFWPGEKRKAIGGAARPLRHTEKLVPHPQEAVATGLLILQEAPIRASTKSIAAPAMYCTETGSTSTVAPSRASTRSSSVLALTKSNLYWKPEQPPPSTLTRSIDPAGSVLRISPIRRAARAVSATELEAAE